MRHSCDGSYAADGDLKVKDRLTRSLRDLPLQHVAAMLVGAGVLLLGVWSFRVYHTVRSLEGHVREAQALLNADPLEVVRSEPERLGTLVFAARKDVVALQRQAGPLIGIAPAFRWLPRVGPLLAQAPALVEMADGLTEGSVGLWDAIAPGGVTFSEGYPRASLLAALERAHLGPVRAALTRAEISRGEIAVNALPWRYQQPMNQLGELLSLLVDGLAFAQVAPELAGLYRARTYLILAQNEDELRPTGGFISGAGLLTVLQGEIIDIRFFDSYTVDDYANKPYEEPPAPLLQYMGSELWLFRDANWSPDFPTSARQAAMLFEYGTGTSVDGVIALNQRFLERLLMGMDYVEVPALATTVTTDNLRQAMYQAWDPGTDVTTSEWLGQRKDFMHELAIAMLDTIQDSPERIDWLTLGQAVHQALATRDLLVYVEGEEAAGVLADLGWDGALRSRPGDTLFIVDANVGFGKVAPLIHRETRYTVRLYEDGTASAELTLTYGHQGQREHVVCDPMVLYDSEVTYEGMIHRCYYDYLRVYVPYGALLRSASHHPTPGAYLVTGEGVSGEVEVFEEYDKTVFGQFFVVEYGQTLTTHFYYDLPVVVRDADGQRRYTLLLQKQSGTGDLPFYVSLELPSGARVVSAAPVPARVVHEKLDFEVVLDQDVWLEVVFE